MDQRNDNNTWVYYNGELYHAGVKGMHWYQHLPGTDWWKNVGTAAKKTYKNSMNKHITYATDPKTGNIIQKKSMLGALKSAGSAAKVAGKMVLGRAHGYLANESRYYKNKIKTATSEQINKYRESARQSYQNKRKEVQNVLNTYFAKSSIKNNTMSLITGKSDINYLASFIYGENGSYQKALNSWIDSSAKGPVGAQLNSFIQTTRFNVASGCAKFLDSIGLDDEVAKFLRKFK